MKKVAYTILEQEVELRFVASRHLDLSLQCCRMQHKKMSADWGNLRAESNV